MFSVRAGVFSLVIALTLAGLAACERRGPETGKIQQAAPSEPSFQTFGDYEVHYNALRTDELTPEVARAYSIERSGNRVLLNVSLLKKGPDGRTVPVDGQVVASAHNLNGQLKDLQLRRIVEGESVYFIGEVGITGNEILVFDIDASPAEQSGSFKVQLVREFFAD